MQCLDQGWWVRLGLPCGAGNLLPSTLWAGSGETEVFFCVCVCVILYELKPKLIVESTKSRQYLFCCFLIWDFVAFENIKEILNQQSLCY